jgi:hypothetical protein
MGWTGMAIGREGFNVSESSRVSMSRAILLKLCNLEALKPGFPDVDQMRRFIG